MRGEFPAQRASNTENVSIWSRHHGDLSISKLQEFTRFGAKTCYRLVNAEAQETSCERKWYTGFPRTRENGKRPWIWNFVPGCEKARNFVIESWKLICDRENWSYEFCLTNKVFVTETQALLCCLHSRNSQTFRVSTTGPRFPISQSKGQNWQAGTRHYFRTCAQSWNATVTKLDKHGNFEARQ